MDARPMNGEDMTRAMFLLDERIEESEFLMSVAPIRLISAGGCLAVCVLGNRESSYDIDCVLDPNIAAAPEYVDEFKDAVERVASAEELSRDWMNRQMEAFITRSKRTAWFLESVQQDITVYEGANLVVYAGRLDWALERKLRRAAHAEDRRKDKDVDVPDAAALIHFMIGDAGRPLTFDYVRGLNYNGFDVPPTDRALREVAQHHVETYGNVGLVELIWDDGSQRHKYKDANDEWVWYD